MHPQKPPRLLISNIHECTGLGRFFPMPAKHTTATNTTFGSGLQAGDSASHALEERRFALELSFPKRTQVT